ncbi:hypothetical protein BDF22DRAFT_1696 [Syncephalis plumigaleata]|nr:hypothetical protein BDF22DRAFT_1696 [Syncephalis plumigaleata]
MNGINAMAGIMADNALSVRVQKAALEQRATGFRIVLETPDAIYHPGDEVKGIVELELSKPLNTREIRVRLCGSMQCFIRRNYCCSDTMELFAQEMVVWSAARAAVQSLNQNPIFLGGGRTSESRPSTSLSNDPRPSGLSRNSSHANNSLDVPTVNVTMAGSNSRLSSTSQTDQEQYTNDDSHCINPCIGISRPRSNSASSTAIPRFDYFSKLKLAPLLRSLGLSSCSASDANGQSTHKDMTQRAGSADITRVQANGMSHDEGGLAPPISASLPVSEREHRRLRSFASMEEPINWARDFIDFHSNSYCPHPMTC